MGGSLQLVKGMIMADEAAKPVVKRTRAARVTRSEEVRTERRRKPGSTTHYGMKLHIDKAALDPAYSYRWANDKGGRIQDLHDEDWDPVKRLEAAGGDGPGTVPQKFVGTEAGKPIKAVLLKKRKEWYDDDQKEKRKPLDEMDKAIRGGTAHQKSNEPELAGEIAYTPGGVNVLDRR